MGIRSSEGVIMTNFVIPWAEDGGYTFTQWLESTRELQVKAFGQVPEELQGDELKNWFMMNVLAATDELHEFLNEVPWKPWSSGMQINRDAAIGELVDCMHFIANLLATLSCTGEELTHRYQLKQVKNAQRQTEGYDGLNKCQKCKRALDDVNTSCTKEHCAYEH